MEPEIVNLAQLLKVKREKAGLTQEQAARMLGITRPRLSVIESGRFDLTMSTVLNLLYLYQVDPGDFFEELMRAKSKKKGKR